MRRPRRQKCKPPLCNADGFRAQLQTPNLAVLGGQFLLVVSNGNARAPREMHVDESYLRRFAGAYPRKHLPIGQQPVLFGDRGACEETLPAPRARRMSTTRRCGDRARRATFSWSTTLSMSHWRHALSTFFEFATVERETFFHADPRRRRFVGPAFRFGACGGSTHRFASESSHERTSCGLIAFAGQSKKGAVATFRFHRLRSSRKLRIPARARAAKKASSHERSDDADVVGAGESCSFARAAARTAVAFSIVSHKSRLTSRPLTLMRSRKRPLGSLCTPFDDDALTNAPAVTATWRRVR